MFEVMSTTFSVKSNSSIHYKTSRIIRLELVVDYQPDYQLNYQPEYQPGSTEVHQPGSSNGAAVRSTASRLMLCSTSRRYATCRQF